MLTETTKENGPIFPTRREIATRIFRQRTIFLVVFLSVFLGFIITGQFKPKYLAEMKVLVLKQRVDPLVTAGQESTPQLQGMVITEEDLNSEAEMLKSGDLLHNVVLQAGLVQPSSADPKTFEMAVPKLQLTLDVSVVAKTDLIAVHYESPDPEQSRRVLATLSSLYLQKQRNVQGPDSQVSFFDKQVREHGDALRRAEEKLLDFTRRTGVVSAELERELTVRRMGDIQEASLQNSAEIAASFGRIKRLSTLIGTEPARVQTDEKQADNPELLNQLNTTLLSLQLKRTDLLNKYDANYRLVVDVDREIAATQSMIKRQMETPVHEQTSSVNPIHVALETDYDTSQANLKALWEKGQSLSNAVAEVKRQAKELTVQNTEQEALLRDVKTQRDEYQLYVDKLEQARLIHSLDQGGILNVAVAEPPGLSALPQNSLPMVLVSAFFAALVLGLGAAFLADVLDPTIRNARDIEETLGMSLLAEFEPFSA